MGVPESPNRRKLRLLRADSTPADLVVVIRATPSSLDETIDDIVLDALKSARTYAVLREGGGREPLFGVSVFARRRGVEVVEILARFDEAPGYLEGRVGELRSAGLVVLPTGANPDHFDAQLLAGQPEGDEGKEPVAAVRSAAARLVGAAGGLRPNPAYAGGPHPMVEER